MTSESKLVKWYRDLEPRKRVLIQASTTAISLYFGAFLGTYLQELLEANAWIAVSIHGAVLLVLTALITFFFMSVATIADQMTEHETLKRRAIDTAHASTDRHVSSIACATSNGKSDPGVFIRHDPVEAIRAYVKEAQKTLQAHFGSADGRKERIDFEVTFMTRSYIDGKITIVAWANRHERAPISLGLRQGNPDIFERTEVAQMYHREYKTIKVIDDTTDVKAGYHELYPDQKDRLKSTVVFPVLSDRSELLGGLVLHCDKIGFFRLVDKVYWNDFAEVFGTRIALEKLRLDHAIKLVEDQSKNLVARSEPPF